MFRPVVAVLLWLVILAFATFKNVFFYWIGEPLGTLTVVAFVLLVSFVHARIAAGPEALGAALITGMVWLALTLLFDFTISFKGNTDVLMAQLRLWEGAYYALFPAAALLGPPLAAMLVRE